MLVSVPAPDGEVEGMALTRARTPIHIRAGWPVAGLLGILLCGLADFILVSWLNAGPPPGKGHLFYAELVAVMGLGFIYLCLSISHPDLGRKAVPFVLLLMAWHTGFQLNWTADTDRLLLSGIDGATVVLVVVALAAGWHRTETARLLLKSLGKPLALYLIFCLWGFCIAVIREVDLSPFYANMKTMTLYPFIAVLVPLCIRSWRELYAATGFFLLCVLERTLEGLRSHSGTGVTMAHTSTGQDLVRITGDMASVNQYAYYIMSGLLLLTALLVAGRRLHLRMALGPAVGLVALALLLTYSRGAWLGLAVGVIVLALLLGARRIAVLVVVVVGAYSMVVATQPSATALVTARLTDAYSQGTITERQNFTQQGIQVIEDYPLGAGWGASFHPTLFGLAEDHASNDAPWYHNDYLHLATEISPAGLAAFLWIWVAILWLGVRTLRLVKNPNQRALVLGLLSAICGMLVQAATDQFFWRTDIGPHAWIIAGLLLSAVALYHVSPSGQDVASSPDLLTNAATSDAGFLGHADRVPGT
jgi:O-antigen ligase